MREGSIIPLKDMEGYDNSIENPEKLEVLVYPGESGEFVLWEDGGDTPEDLDENWVSTRMTKTADEKMCIRDSILRKAFFKHALEI